jgi:hypothetical protein
MRQHSPGHTFATYGRVQPDTTHSFLSPLYTKHTALHIAQPSPAFEEYSTGKRDNGVDVTLLTESFSALHTRGISLDTRDVNGISTGGIVGAAIGAIVFLGLIFGLLVWKCALKMI